MPPGGGGGGGPRPPRPERAGREEAGALKVRRLLTLLVLTLIAPGSAQVVTGPSPASRRPAGLSRARMAVATTTLRIWLGGLALTVLLVLLAFVNRNWVLGLFTHQWVIRPLALLFLSGAVVWPVLLLDAWRIGQAPELTQRSRRWIALLTAVLMVLALALPLAVGRRVWAAADLLSGVFGSGKNSAAVDGRYNVLLLGGDTGPSRVGTRTDSVNLASIDEKTGQTALFSLPRNLQNVPFPAGTPAARALPNGWICGDVCLLNAIYKYGEDNPKLFPPGQDPGAEAMMQAVQGVTGLKVNYYVIIDLQGFQDLIDAVGGVDMNVTARTPIGNEHSKVRGWIEPGQQRLDGFHALWYARSRDATSDYDRMARQRCVMNSMLSQLDPATVLRNFQGIAAAGSKVVATDIPAGKLPAFLDLAQKAKHSQIKSVQFVPPVIVPKHPDFTEIRRLVASTIAQLEGRGTAASTPKATVATAAPTESPAASSSSPGPKVSQGTEQSSQNASVDVRSVCGTS